jgi:hypothetical protein
MNLIFETYMNAIRSNHDVMNASVQFRKQMLKQRWRSLQDYKGMPNEHELVDAFYYKNNLMLSAYIDARLRDGFATSKKTRKQRKRIYNLTKRK